MELLGKLMQRYQPLNLEVVPTLPTSAVGSVVMLLEAFLRVGMAKVQRQLAGEASP